LKLALLTTETSHHAYFAWQLHERFPISLILDEQRHAIAPFETAHPFERSRDDYERSTLLAGGPRSLREVGETIAVDSVNDPSACETLASIKPDVVILFGTGRICETVRSSARIACLNLHGGNPEEYRGLDSHLWAIYHGDFANLVTTLHHVDGALDTGDIALQDAVAIDKTTELYQLRARNTQACVELGKTALSQIACSGRVARRRQTRRGRYYSFMPAVLKEQCLTRFNRYVQSL
jgi:methionyl-tRNA formyltransferase